jgi:hypothetical protein
MDLSLGVILIQYGRHNKSRTVANYSRDHIFFKPVFYGLLLDFKTDGISECVYK